MPPSLQRWKLKLVAAFFLSFAGILAQDPTSLLTPGVARVGEKLACRCGTCRNTVANCPMLMCHYGQPMRARIKAMQEQGMGDQAIINAIVQQEGVVALAAPPANGWGLLTWVMPGIALLAGFWLYSWWVRRNRASAPAAINDTDSAVLDRFRSQIDAEMDDAEDGHRSGPRISK